MPQQQIETKTRKCLARIVPYDQHFISNDMPVVESKHTYFGGALSFRTRQRSQRYLSINFWEVESLWKQIGVTRHFREQASYALTTNPTTTYYFRRRLPLVLLFAFGFSICRNKYLSSPPAYAFSFGNIFLESFV
jgi:hypothetical protein